MALLVAMMIKQHFIGILLNSVVYWLCIFAGGHTLLSAAFALCVSIPFSLFAGEFAFELGQYSLTRWLESPLRRKKSSS